MTASASPFVSIVMPALNCEGEVQACIEALRRQDYPVDRVQIVVADNGSRDGTGYSSERADG